jgi:4-hydroxy-4-methyl-2-oxoglutarate aldolase
VPVACDGVIVNPGDPIIADGGGVICVPRAEAEGSIAGALARLNREGGLAEAIKGGAHPWELAKMQEPYDALGVREIDGTYGVG